MRVSVERHGFSRAAALLVSALALVFATPVHAQSPDSLKPLISAKYPDVEWVSTKDLAQWLREPENKRPVLLDVRTSEEYGVSSMKGAKRLDPDNPDVKSLKIATDAKVVVYCSVGYRSAAVVEHLNAAGIRDVHNVEGGIFQWANEGRPVYQGKKRAKRVHPYDSTWGRLLKAEHRAPPPK